MTMDMKNRIPCRCRRSYPLSVRILVGAIPGGVIPLGMFLSHVLPEDVVPPHVFYMILYVLIGCGIIHILMKRSEKAKRARSSE